LFNLNLLQYFQHRYFMAAAADYVYRRNPAELTLPRFYEGDFQISGVHAFESSRDTFDAIKSEILQETNSRST